MTADPPDTDPHPWPEPPECPGCGAPNRPGASPCWLCGADLPADLGRVAPPAPATPTGPTPGRWPRPRPRVTIATTMIAIGVLAVFFAVGRGQAGILVGLVLVVGPAVGHLVARARRVDRGDDRPSAVERALGEVAATILVVTVAAAVVAATLILAAELLRGLADA